MVVFPNAKINIGLRILNERNDGFHNIESGMFPLYWKDILEIIPSGESSFEGSGLEINATKDDNLVWKSYLMMRNKYDIPPLKIYLHKNIPTGAGLGGGSSDCAFTIKAINKLFKLNLENKEMEGIASELGSDCPFFIQNKPSFVSGTGTILATLDHTLREKWVIVVNPGINISTKSAYSNLKGTESKETDLKNTLSGPVEDWKNTVVNDFEPSILSAHKQISKLKTSMYESGAEYASMSGSGSSVYGIFDKPKSLEFGMPSWSGSILV